MAHPNASVVERNAFVTVFISRASCELNVTIPNIMSTAFYLIPGAMLPREVASDVLAALPADVRDALTALGVGREAPGLQRLSEPLHEYSPHRAWLWKVLTHRTGAPVSAPYAWIAEGGPKLDQEFWALSPWSTDETGHLQRFTFDEALIPQLACALDPVIFRLGMRLMISGTNLFATRRESLDLTARPFRDLVGMSKTHFAHLDYLATGAEIELARTIRTAALEAARPILGDRLQGFWLSGGGFAEPVFPPSKFRSVVTDDPVSLAWAESAGIPRSALGKLKNRTEWPTAPEGDRILVLDTLYSAWLAGDWQAWREKVPTLLSALAHWRSLEKAAKIDENVLVFFGHGGAATLLPEKRGALSFFRRAAKQPIESWLFDSVDTSASEETA